MIDKLNLTDDPEYNAKLWPKGLLAKFTNDLLGTKNNNLSGAKNEDEHTKAKIIDSFLRRLQVQNVPRSRALEVSFRSVDPKKAAAIANSIAEEYIEAKLDSRFESVQRASAWLADRVQSLRAQLTQSEKAIENYRNEHNLYEDGGSTLVARQISDLNSKSIDAKMELIAAEANFAEARRLLNSPGSMGTTAVQVLQSDTIRQFREQELQLDRKVAEMSNQYGMRHPAMVQVQAQRHELRNKIREEIERITKSLENQVRIAQTREASLARDLDELKTKQAKLDHALLGLRVLERNAEANRLILQKMMASSIEASAQNDIASQVAGARVVSPAAVPDRPSFPRPSVLLPVALLTGAVTGVVLAFAFDKLRTGFRSAEQTELGTGLPVLAHVPNVAALKRASISEYLQKKPASAFAEAIRALYMRLMLMKNEFALGVLLVISPQAEEGKTTICASLARQHAQLGRRVVVVDGDFRRSSLAKSLGLKPSPGLSELLVGTAEVTDVVQRDPSSAADFIVAGQHWVDSGLLVSNRLT